MTSRPEPNPTTTLQVTLRRGQRLERRRVARELHDTLLQGIQGLILKLHGVADSPGLDGATRARLESIASAAQGCVEQTRDAIADLRASPQPDGDLPSALRALAAELDEWGRQRVSVRTIGTPCLVVPWVTQQTFCICREALINALKHSGGSLAQVWLCYSAQQLEVMVADDGRPVRASPAASVVQPIAWGAIGMRERAQLMGATLTMQRLPDQGFLVTLGIPAATAYALTPQPPQEFPTQCALPGLTSA